MQKESDFAKKIILEFLDYVRFKVKNDKLTMEEADSIAKTIQEGFHLLGTIDDLAAFYGQSKTNIKTVICRKLISKPQRRVFYSFNAFQRIVPTKWKEKPK